MWLKIRLHLKRVFIVLAIKPNLGPLISKYILEKHVYVFIEQLQLEKWNELSL